MLKHKSKILILAIISLLFINTFSFAEEAVTTNINDNTSTENPANEEVPIENQVDTNDVSTENQTTEDIPIEEEHNPTEESTIISEDQYLFGNTINMDKLVDGNVYIIGNDVTISGKVAGNLFVFADKVTFTEDSVIQYSAFVSAKDVKFNGAAYDLYNISGNITFGSTALIGRDFRTASNSVDLKGIIIRNAIISAPNITIPEATTVNDETSINESNFIYGSLIYYSNNELTIPEGYVQEGTFFNKLSAFNTTNSNKVMSYITSGLTLVLFTLFIYGALHLRKNSNMDKAKNLVKNRILPILGFGIISVIVLLIAGFGFSFINITLPIGLLAFVILLFALFISLPLTAILVANVLSEKLPIAKSLLVLITSIVLWILTLIPYFNIFVYILATIFVLGYLFFSTYGNTEIKAKEIVEKKNEEKNEETEIKQEENLDETKDNSED